MANSSRGRGEGASIIWGVAALLIIGGFFAWLAVTAEPSVPPAPPGEAANDAGPASDARPVGASEFAANTASFTGQTIELADVPVVQQMGRQIFWVELPGAQGATPYLVKLGDAMVAAGGSLPAAETRVNVEGVVMQKSDSVLNAWEQAGVLENAGHRAQAEYGDTYIEARAIRPAR
jgi:hypothetical protein